MDAKFEMITKGASAKLEAKSVFDALKEMDALYPGWRTSRDMGLWLTVAEEAFVYDHAEGRFVQFM